MSTPNFRNTLLQRLDDESVARLGLSAVTFELGHEIEFPGQPIAHVFFVEEGMASMTNTFEDGSQVEVGTFGYESVIGVSALMGSKRSLNRVYTQITGRGYSCGVDAARREFERGGVFQTLCLRYVQAQLLQSMQSAGCNVKHNVEQRLSRWLLICGDRAQSGRFRMSHEFLADMLGSSRPTVSVAAGLLKDEGLVEYSRGVMEITDRVGLERRACECYRVIKNHLDNFAEFDTGQVE
jgi:CRP-like cAMP-binding protein